MERLVALALVMILGYYIMSEPQLGNGCFNWCDVGKGMLGLAITNITILLVKGPAKSVRIVN